MIAAAALVLFAALASTLGARLLVRASWPLRSPAWGIWAWQVLTISAAAALVLAGVVVVLPETPLAPAVTAALRSCSDALAEHYGTPGGLPVAASIGAVSAAIVLRFGTLVARELRRLSGVRRAQRDTLTLIGDDRPEGFTLIEHAAPLIYCVPGRTERVVVTSGARDLLTTHQLDLVLAHERRHLNAHHHAALTLSGALSRTFGGFGVFGMAHQQICTLIEMQADDAVSPAPDRLDLAHALLSLAPGGAATTLAPHGSFASTGSVPGGAAVRVRRLTERAERSRGVALLAATAGGAALVAPVLLALVPAVEAVARDCCTTTFTQASGSPPRSSGLGAGRTPDGGLLENLVD